MGNKVSVRHYNKRAQDASASERACLHGCLVGSHTLLQGKDSLCSSSLIFQHHLLFIDTRDAVVNLLNLLLVCLLALQRHQCSCSQVGVSLVTRHELLRQLPVSTFTFSQKLTSLILGPLILLRLFQSLIDLLLQEVSALVQQLLSLAWCTGASARVVSAL